MARRRRTRMRTNLGEVTKQDFVAIARIFCKRQVPAGAASDLADYFASQNPRFQRERFLAATRKC